MAAKDKLSSQFVRLYRGLYATDPTHLEKYPQIGSHWSKSPDVAYNFATYRDSEGIPHHDAADEETPLAGTVVEALIHKRNIIDPHSKEGKEWQVGENVLGPDHLEQERTVRPGSPVHIQYFHYFDDTNDTYKSVKPQRRKGYRA